MARQPAAWPRACALLLMAMVSVLTPATAPAHLGNLSHADFTVRGGDVLLRFRYAVHVTPGLPPGSDLVTRRQVVALEGRLTDWLSSSSTVDSAAGRCTFALDNMVGPDSEQNLEVTAVWTCPTDSLRGLNVNFHPLSAVMNDWQTIASMRLDAKDYSTVLTPDATRWIVGEPFALPSATPDDAAGDAAACSVVSGAASAACATGEAPPSSSFARFFALGVHHIWTGYDHLLFLLAVLLAGGGLRRLAAIVTSFTLAHSLTLGAAATGLVRLPVAPVEAAIALSIVAVAAENIAQRGADRRALVTFAFGLVHGFGFASVLADTALPAAGVVVPLLAFNLGVETGQLAVVAVVVPVLSVALRSRHARRVQVTLSALVALAGAAWAVERITAMLG